jgi:hypothetical protein
MTYSMCAYKRGESISGHWCNECPPNPEYGRIERAQKAAWAARNKKKREKS